ncbi:MAG TPA: hypothetical protein VF821_23155 [Lentzea sp.]
MVALVTWGGLSAVAGRLLHSYREDDSSMCMVLIVIAVVILGSLPLLPQGGFAVLHGPDRRYLTATTITGTRTVDLARLAEVWRYRLPDGSQRVDRLMLRDADGVRLMVDSAEFDRAIRTHCTDDVLVSGPARKRLGLPETSGTQRFWWWLGHPAASAAVALLGVVPVLLVAWAAYALSGV